MTSELTNLMPLAEFLEHINSCVDGCPKCWPKKVICPLPDMEATKYSWDEETQSMKVETISMSDIYKEPENAIEKAAHAGYEHSMKILDFLHPDTEHKFTWENENEKCKDEWRDKANLMLMPTLKSIYSLRTIIRNIIDELDCDPSNWLLIRDEIKAKLASCEYPAEIEK